MNDEINEAIVEFLAVIDEQKQTIEALEAKLKESRKLSWSEVLPYFILGGAAVIGLIVKYI